MNPNPPPTVEQASAAIRLRTAWRRIRTSPFWMFGIAAFLRVGWIIVGHTFRVNSAFHYFGFGWEMGRIGEAIASGQGFSNPFDAPTGPTAWEPPLYPYLTAGVFHFLGIYSPASNFLLLSINSIFSALTCIPIFLIARRIFSEKVAVGSAWTWALLPYAMAWCTRWVWETSLSALLMAVLFWLALTMEDRDGMRPWVWFGLLWGIAALNSTVLVSFLPASGLWAWYRRTKRGKSSLAGIALASIVFIACVTPWIVRNYETFHTFIFIRDNFGAELRLGNGRLAEGMWMAYLHPSQDLYGLQQYEAMGELPYIAMRKQQAIDYIKADYGRFGVLCLKRFVYFWAGGPRLAQVWWLSQVKNSLFLASSVLMFWGLGRALRQSRPGAWLLFWLILCYPAVYYVVFTSQRYRHPIEPEMTILGIFLITEATWKSRRRSRDVPVKG